MSEDNTKSLYLREQIPAALLYVMMTAVRENIAAVLLRKRSPAFLIEAETELFARL